MWSSAPTLLFSFLLACNPDKGDDSVPPAAKPPLSDAQLAGLSMTRLKADVDYLASDDLGGRTPESVGHGLARDYIIAELTAVGLTPAGNDGGYTIPFEMALPGRYGLDASGDVISIDATQGVNIAALLPGSDPARMNETLVIMAHYDHLGVNATGDAYNGAFDDATGVAVLLELARLFHEADLSPARSILFLVTDGEENGLNGARAWVSDPTFALDDVVLAMSLDPLGRPLLPDYDPLILLGLERSPDLQAKIRDLSAFADMDVAFVNRGPIPVYSSDQDAFFDAVSEVPAFWVVSPGMTWYHTVEDTAETIDYRSVQHHAAFLAQLIFYVGDDDVRYVDEGEQPLSVTDAQDCADLLDGVLGSAELSDDERDQATDLRDRFTDAVASGEAGEALESTFLSSVIFLLLDLTAAHPGEVPPPFPN